MSFPLEAGKTYYFKGSSYWTQNITLSLTREPQLRMGDNTVTLDAYQSKKWSFVAPEAGKYYFYSVNAHTLNATLYDSSNNYLDDSSGYWDDDVGIGTSNFVLSREMEEGERVSLALESYEAGKFTVVVGSSLDKQRLLQQRPDANAAITSLTLDQSGKNLLQNRDNQAYATFTAPAAGTYTFYSVVSEYMEFQNVYDENWVPLDEKDYSRPYVLNNNAGVQLSMTEGQTVNFKLYLSGETSRIGVTNSTVDLSGFQLKLDGALLTPETVVERGYGHTFELVNEYGVSPNSYIYQFVQQDDSPTGSLTFSSENELLTDFPEFTFRLSKTEWDYNHSYPEWLYVGNSNLFTFYRTFEEEDISYQVLSGNDCVRFGDWTNDKNDPSWPVLSVEALAPGTVEVQFTLRETELHTETVWKDTLIVVAQSHKHQYTQKTVEATCQEQGYTLYTCACGYSYKDDYTEVAEHSFGDTVTVAPTCKEYGYDVRTCSVCGYKEYSNYNYNHPDHSWETVQEIPGTCSTEGYELKECSVCHQTETEWTGYDYDNHNWVEDEDAYIAPTCEDEGRKASRCTRCGDTHNEWLDPLGHDFESEHIPATCGSYGKTHYQCKNCDYSYDRGIDEERPTGKHDYELEWSSEATCTEDGYELMRCKVCGEFDYRTTENALGHTWTVEKTVEPTCTQDGYERRRCTACNETRTFPLDATGHHYVYTDAGNGKHTAECSVCHATLSAEPHEFDANGVCRYCGVNQQGEHVHHYLSEITTDPTCTTPGEVTYTCACGDSYTKQIPAAHSWDRWEYDNDPTCDHTGKRSHYCLVCDEHEEEVIPQLSETGEHSWVERDCENPGCDWNGYVEYYCSVCHQEKTETLAALGHDWEDLTGEEYPSKEPTETENGYKWVRCKNCGDERSITLPALGHTHSITASNWNWNFWASEPYVKEVTFRCEDCGFSEQVTVSGKNVTSEVTKEPTCTRDGIKTWTATVEYEGKTYTDTYEQELGSLWHDYDYENQTITKPATCTDSGERTCECKRCHETSTELISPLGHSYGEWTVTKPSSCGEDGEATSTCTRCQHQKTRVLEASPHDWDTPVWTWAEDYSSASVTLTCKKNASHTVTQKATIRRETVDADCENAGEVVCTATAKVNGETFTDTKTVNNTALGHDWRVPYWTWLEDGTEATATFVCKNNSSHRDTVTASGDAITSEAPVEGSCTEGTQVTRTATVTHDGKTFTNTKTFTADAPGHKWGEPVWQWDKDHNATAVFTCENDPSHTVSVRASTVSSSTVAYSSCTQGRKVEYTASLLFNDQLYTDTVTETGEPEGHIWYPPVWSWNDEHTAATATFVCGRDNSHTTTVDAVITSDTSVSCGENGTVTYTATVTLDGLTYTDTKTDEVTALAHDWQTPTWTWNEEHTAATATFVCSRNYSHTTTVDAVVTTQTNPDTCEEAGGTVYTATVMLEGKEYTDTYRQDGQALGHDWDTPTWSWNGDHTQATATFICKRDVTHFKTLTATGKAITEETTAATCEKGGKTVYTATVNLNGTNYTNSDTMTLNQLGHDWKKPTWTWNNDHTAATAHFVCGNDASHPQDVVAVVTTQANPDTCEEAGSTVYTATVTFNGKDYTDTVTVTGQALGHDWDTPTWSWNGDHTQATATFTCKHDNNHTEVLDAEGDAITVSSSDADCETPGTVTYTATVNLNGKDYTDTVNINGQALGHSWKAPTWEWNEDHSKATATFVCERNSNHVRTVEATGNDITSLTTAADCETDGSIVYTARITLDGQSYTGTDTVTLEKTGHNWKTPTWVWNDNHTEATASFVCNHNPNHTRTLTATGEDITSVTTDATCTEDGKTVYTAKVTLNGSEYTNSDTVTLNQLGHDWKKPTWEWNNDHTEATATFKCGNDASHTHKETATDKAITADETAATCDSAKSVKYTAKVSFNGEEYSDSVSVTEGEALGHDWGEPEWIWNGDHSKATATFTCTRDDSHTKTLTATGEDITSVTTAATCTEDGKTVYTAKVTLNGTEYTNSDTVTLNQLGHNWKAPTWEWNNDHTEATATFKCGNDASHTHTETATGKAITADETAATCDSAKSVKYTAKVSFNGEEYTDSVSVTEGEALGHDWGEWSTVNDATCTEKGKEQRECGNCHQTEERSTDALGHSWGKWTVKKAATCTEKGKEQRECGNCRQTEDRSTNALGHDWDSGKVTREPTADATGVMTYTCKRCSTTRTEPIPKLVNAGPTKKNVITVNAKGFTVEGKTNLVKTTYNTKKVTLDLKASAQGGAKLSYKSSNKKKLPVKNGKVTIPAKFIGSTTITITSAATQDYKATTLKLTLQVNPTKTKLNTLTNVKGKKLTVKWSENNTCKGYQVAYSTDKKFKKGTVTKNIGKQKTTSVTLTGLTLKKQYYVRVRTVSGKNYSDWSNVKNIEISK